MAASSGRRGFTIFSGDCFSPSLESSLSLGAHMVPVLNSLGIDVACPGNHDFDYGEARLKTLLESTYFPWTLCNYLKPGSSMDVSSMAKSEGLLAGMCSYVVKETHGFRFGFFGIGGTDWPSLCQYLPPCRVESPVSAARKVARHLRITEKCDVVIAITHMRLAEDLKVSEATIAHDDCHVDLILGGHDHEPVCRLVGDTCPDPTNIWQDIAKKDIVVSGRVPAVTGGIRIIKSGSDFESFSHITLCVERQPNGRARLIRTSVQQVVDITQTREYHLTELHSGINCQLVNIQRQIGRLVETPIARMQVPLDGKETLLRTRETNLGNFLCDLLRLYFNTDIAFVNSGSIRCDRQLGSDGRWKRSGGDVYPSQLLRIRDVLGMYVLLKSRVTDHIPSPFPFADSILSNIEILPFRDNFEIRYLTGHELLQLFEIAVSEDSPEGRFLQISGASFDANKNLPVGKRVSNACSVVFPYGKRQKPTGDESSPHIPCGVDFRTPIQLNALYTVVVSSFLAQGYDGYEFLKTTPSVRFHQESEKLTHAELVIRIFGASLQQNRPRQQKGPSNNVLSLINSCFTGAKHSPKELRAWIWEHRALRRARQHLVIRNCEKTGLPIISPKVDGRINLVEAYD